MIEIRKIILSVFAVCLLYCSVPGQVSAQIVSDAAGRKVEIPDKIQRVICSGPGALRLLTYLEAQDKIVAVDSMEKGKRQFDARPYALANPQFKYYPIFGEFRGYDNPERILALHPPPQVIFKTFPTMGHDPRELQKKTGIPVVILNYGDLGSNRRHFFQSLRIMGQVLHLEKRTEVVISFFESTIADLKKRTRDIPENDRPSCFVGGIAFRGPHGFQSTEPGYPPFGFLNIHNPAFDPSMKKKALRHSNIAKEKIVMWNPDYLFLDLSSLQLGDKAGALYELQTDPVFRLMTAVEKGRVFGLLPYNWYTRNFGSILTNAYFVGKLLYPDRFADIEPAVKADVIYNVLVGKAVFAQMNQAFDHLVFKTIPLD